MAELGRKICDLEAKLVEAVEDLEVSEANNDANESRIEDLEGRLSTQKVSTGGSRVRAQDSWSAG